LAVIAAFRLLIDGQFLGAITVDRAGDGSL